jgi:cell division septation protein DedD
MPTREPELYKDKIEVSLDGRQIFYLFFGGAVIVGLVFVLGVLVGRRVESRGHHDRAATQTAVDPLAALDRLERTDQLSFHGTLTGGEPHSDVEKAIADLEKRRAASKPEPKPEAKLDAKPDGKLDARHDVKPEPKPEAKSEAKARSEAERAERKARHDDGGEARHVDASRPVTRPEGKDGGRTDVKAESKGDKGEARSEKSEKGEKGDKGDRAEAREKSERADKGDKTDRTDKGDKTDRTDKGDKTDRTDKGEARNDRTDRSERADRADKGEARGDRSERADKPEARSDKIEARSDRADGKPSVEARVRFTLQLSSFQDRAEADAFLATMKSAGFQPYVTEADVSGKGTFYRVRLGSYRSLEAANDAKAEFEKSAKKTAQVMRL